ncbi:hypothetical protein LPC08_05010 [Roseomonas sp. OT10]|uniref:hypothetical protein n=1 Tax=Roseomonas cutis TaxID=2897332 RepID=UPI001E2AE7D4|nr:hypothetical protein [Roseomonas sp. OT10]UFN50001.1 hypothetical protein LPC08_05010 [Roseomonas sp. OT10]
MRALLALPILGLATLASPAQAGALDSLYDSTIGRLPFFAPRDTAEAPRPRVNEATEREQEARNLRRDYWLREKARLEQDRLARARGPASAGPVSGTVTEVASVAPR